MTTVKDFCRQLSLAVRDILVYHHDLRAAYH